ncbi:MAG TPA: DUF4136 domain-containing protein [Labilithrix sp.]|nr:DUF4136 domain-containing protein [Labilithrix sp.]
MSSLLVTRLLPVAALGCALALGCHKTPGSTMQVRTNSAVVGSVAHHRTYSHQTADQAPAGYSTASITPELLEKVRRRIDVEMEKKGYVLVPSGDLVVRISSGVRVVDDQPAGSMALAGAPVEPDRVTSLVIDVFERNSEGHLFHGYAKDELHSKQATDKQIDEAVTKILEPLPARNAAP